MPRSILKLLSFFSLPWLCWLTSYSSEATGSLLHLLDDTQRCWPTLYSLKAMGSLLHLVDDKQLCWLTLYYSKATRSLLHLLDDKQLCCLTMYSSKAAGSLLHAPLRWHTTMLTDLVLFKSLRIIVARVSESADDSSSWIGLVNQMQHHASFSSNIVSRNHLHQVNQSHCQDAKGLLSVLVDCMQFDVLVRPSVRRSVCPFVGLFIF